MSASEGMRKSRIDIDDRQLKDAAYFAAVEELVAAARRAVDSWSKRDELYQREQFSYRMVELCAALTAFGEPAVEGEKAK